MRRLIPCLVLAGALSSGAAHADKPSKEEIAEARKLYQRGVEMYREGAYDAALIELQRAYDTAPSYKILYNIGLVQLQLNDYAGALKAYRRYLDEGDKKIDAKRRAEVEREIEKLQGRVASVTVKVSVDEAEILVDDLPVGRSPLSEPLLVNAGRRKITATKSGYQTMSRKLMVGGGEEKELELNLRSTSQATAPAGSPPGTPPPSTPPGDQPPPDTVEESSGVPWFWWGATGVLAAGTAVAGVLTLSAESDLEDKRSQPTSRGELDDASQKTRTLAIVTDVLLAGTVITGGVALYLTLDGSSSSEPEKEAVGVRVGPGSVMVTGRF